jgi:hypothetical protein
MRFLIVVLLMAWAVPTTAQTIDCKSIVSPLDRLHCFDAASTPGARSWRDELSSILQTPATAVAALAAIFALISGVVGPSVQLMIGRGQTAANASALTAMNVGNREIARLRIGWIDKVRDVLSEYHAILMSDAEPDADEEVHLKLLQLGTQLDLLLNPDDKLQKALWDVADAIFKTEDFEARRRMDPDLMAAGRNVFNGEAAALIFRILMGCVRNTQPNIRCLNTDATFLR